MNSSDDLFSIGQRLLDDDERALWELRRQNLISDDSADGWRNLALILARRHIPGFPYHREPARRALIKALTMVRKKAGRPPRYGPNDRADILWWVETWMMKNPPTGTLKKRKDKEAAFALRQAYPEICKGVTDRTVTNWISAARREREQAVRVRALKHFHEK